MSIIKRQFRRNGQAPKGKRDVFFTYGKVTVRQPRRIAADGGDRLAADGKPRRTAS